MERERKDRIYLWFPPSLPSPLLPLLPQVSALDQLWTREQERWGRVRGSWEKESLPAVGLYKWEREGNAISDSRKGRGHSASHRLLGPYPVPGLSCSHRSVKTFSRLRPGHRWGNVYISQWHESLFFFLFLWFLSQSSRISVAMVVLFLVPWVPFQFS